MFTSREEAGRRLGEHLKIEGVHADIVLGLPRGGVVVAAEVARVLEAPLDALIVRKIGHPLYREFAVGALAENDVVVFDPASRRADANIRDALERVVAEEKGRMHSYEAKFHPDGARSLESKAVLLVDDGLATGATMEAAVLAAKKAKALSAIVAVPVASTSALDRLLQVADDVRALLVDPEFDAVGRYYKLFSQTTDEEVMDLLHAERRH